MAEGEKESGSGGGRLERDLEMQGEPGEQKVKREYKQRVYPKD